MYVCTCNLKKSAILCIMDIKMTALTQRMNTFISRVSQNSARKLL